jgi:hypothetical protein
MSAVPQAMGSVVLPAALSDVTIAADNDRSGSSAAAKGLPRAVKHLQSEGRSVYWSKKNRRYSYCLWTWHFN